MDVRVTARVTGDLDVVLRDVESVEEAAIEAQQLSARAEIGTMGIAKDLTISNVKITNATPIIRVPGSPDDIADNM